MHANNKLYLEIYVILINKWFQNMEKSKLIKFKYFLYIFYQSIYIKLIEIDEILSKHYKKEQLEDARNTEISFYNIDSSDRVIGSFLIGLKPEFTTPKDHNVFKEIIQILDGYIKEYFEFITCYVVIFKNDYLDLKNLKNVILIRYIEPNSICKIADKN